MRPGRIRRFAPMTLRSTIRWLIWVSCWTVALLAGRTARAAAPMCDDRGLSAIAPAPVLPARDVKIDAGLPLGCDVPAIGVAPLGPHARSQTVVVEDGFDDAWVRPAAERLPMLAQGHAFAISAVLLPVSPGFGRGVFRPPRG
jgi:hypothetical protein